MLVIRYFLALVLAIGPVATSALQAAIPESKPPQELPQPSRLHQPADVVRIVMEALANNDEPFTDAGIATTFAFASPGNRVNTGPLEKFSRMVRNPVYGIMIDHVEREFSEVVITGNQAYQMVKVTGASGAQTIFAFRLSQQADGRFEGMWMTDAVWPVASGDLPEQAF